MHFIEGVAHASSVYPFDLSFFKAVLFFFSDTSLIILRKVVGNVTDITLATFNPVYMFNFSEAVRVCEILNGVLATKQQIQAAWDEGFQQCR